MSDRLIPEFLKARIRELPERPGVYLFKTREGVPVYIGKALSIRKRVMGHFRYYGESFTKEGALLAQTKRIDIIETPTEAEALLLESGLVKEFTPKYNQLLKDDKSYPYLKITAEKFPRILVVRGRKADGSKYFGPYTNAALLRQAVKMLRREFPLRICRTLPKKVCLAYHIGQCGGPCESLQTEESYQETVRELERFLTGRRDALVRNLSKRMKAHAESREYEKAKLLYEQIRALSIVPTSANPAVPAVDALEILRKELSLPRMPQRIECFDISNIQGREAVGSMTVFVAGEPARDQYRRFRIREVRGIDDYQMMREVIRRRYTKVVEGELSPDLVVIDGGKGHLAAAKGVLDDLGLRELPILSIAKQHEYLFVPGRMNPYVFPPNSPHLALIRRLRDEAHRFAITYHRKLHRKEALLSAYDTIPGVGPRTRKILLSKGGAPAKIAAMDGAELARRTGLSEALAVKIIDHLRSRRES